MNPLIPTWAAVLSSAIQEGCYTALSNATEMLMTSDLVPDSLEESSILRHLIYSFMVKHGESVGSFLGFALSWPIANKFGRRNGLLLATLLLLPLTTTLQLMLFLHNDDYQLLFPLFLPSRLSTGLDIGTHLGLYLLLLFEVHSSKWRASALIAYFLVRRICCGMGELLSAGYFGGADDQRWPVVVLLTFAIVPAAAQAASLACISAATDAAHNGNVEEQVRLDLEPLGTNGHRSPSPSIPNNDVSQLGDGEQEFGAVPRKVGLILALISLTFLFLNGPFYTHNPLMEMLERSDTFHRQAEDGRELQLEKVMAVVALAWTLTFAHRFTAKQLIFSELLCQLLIALLRLLAVLLTLGVVTALDFNVSGGLFWGFVAMLVYALDVTGTSFAQALPLPFLFNMLMEMADGRRERAGMLVRPTLIAFCTLGGVTLGLKLVFGVLLAPWIMPADDDPSISYLLISWLGGVAFYLGVLVFLNHAARLMEMENGGGGGEQTEGGGGESV